MPLNFTAIDFETANGSPASPCAVGLVKVAEGKIVDAFSTLIQPPYPNDWFATGNIKVHGINPEDVLSAPSWDQALEQMLEFIDGDDLIAHNAGFDMGVLKASASLIDATLPDLRYGCSLIMARKTYNLESYRLNQVAYAIGHSPLVKTAFFASDPNLGRILAAVGYAGITDLDQTKIDLYLDDVHVAVHGGRNPAYKEEDGQRVMQQSEITVRVVLGRGAASETIWTCDLSHEYVSINADYRS